MIHRAAPLHEDTLRACNRRHIHCRFFSKKEEASWLKKLLQWRDVNQLRKVVSHTASFAYSNKNIALHLLEASSHWPFFLLTTSSTFFVTPDSKNISNHLSSWCYFCKLKAQLQTYDWLEWIRLLVWVICYVQSRWVAIYSHAGLLRYHLHFVSYSATSEK